MNNKTSTTVTQSLVTKLFENADFDPDLRGDLTSVKVGGLKKGSDSYPALYISSELAQKALLGQLNDALIPGQPWCWDEKPIIEQFQMTEAQTRYMTHRVVAPRYAGYCSILRIEANNVD